MRWPALMLLPLMLLTALAVFAVPQARAAELVMFEQKGCEWCARWHAEIGPIYPKTEEGRQAPLRRVDIHEPMPDDLGWMKGERFTPSFALIEDGREIGRIRGYPGQAFFWGLLGQMIEKLAPTDEGEPSRPASG